MEVLLFFLPTEKEEIKKSVARPRTFAIALSLSLFSFVLPPPPLFSFIKE